MKYLVVIPARGGSKGIPHKNIYPIAGKPLLGYAIECMQQAKVNYDMVVSTDDAEIEKVANTYAHVTVIQRPPEISNDTAKTEDALIHALQYMEQHAGKTYDAVVTLQPTSPLRKPETVEKFLKKFEEKQNRYDAQLTLSANYSDFWVEREDGEYGRLFPNAPRRRQERQPLYVENSCLYVTKTQSLMDTRLVLGHKCAGYVIDEVEAIDINEWSDIAIAEGYLEKER
ncbi:MAG: acylneuraminate cytidylyltransferase family protein [Lachnospiraceae bacterium]|nr:acylneuraminate cytidylyltransferase family protein [Lachnospiraceae bacterium]